MTLVLEAPAPAVPDLPTAAPNRPERSGTVLGAGWLGAGAVTAKACQTVVLLVFAALLDPASFGVISLAAVLLNVTTVLADLGTSTALVHVRGDAERAARTAVSLALGVSAVLVATVWLAAPSLAAALNAGDRGAEVLRGIVLCTPLAALAAISGELLRRALDFRRRVVPDVVGNVVGAAVTIASLAEGSGPMALVHGQLVQAVVVLAAFWLLRRPVLPGWSSADARTLLSFGGSLAAGGMLTLVVLNVDYVVVAHRLGTEDVGTYSMAFRMAYMPYLLIGVVIGGAVFAHLCRLRGPAVGAAAVDAAVVLHTLVVPVYVGLLVLAPQLRLLGEQWAAAVPALRWLAGYGLVLSALELILVSLKSVARTPVVLGLTALHLVLLVALLVPSLSWGVTGVAAAQLLAGLLTLAAALLAADRYVDGVRWPELLRRSLPIAAGAAALVATALAARAVLPWGEVSWPGLAVVGTLSAGAYAATVLVLGRGGLPGADRFRGRSRGRVPGRAVLVGAGVVLAAGGVGAAAVLDPVAALLAAAGLGALVLAVRRVEWIALAYVAAEPFGDLLREVHPAAVKAIGALLFLAWLARLAQDPRVAGLRQGGVVALGALMTVLLASFVLRGADLATGADHALSYVSYALVVVVLVDTVRRARPEPLVFAGRLVAAYLFSCTAAGLVAIGDFLAHGGRGAGPLQDPNDLAFFLLAALPFTLVVGRRSPAAATAAATCAMVLLVAIAVTFSRGALLGLVAMVAVALYLGALRATTVVTAALAALAVVGGLWAANAVVVDRALAEKDHIAAENVDLRFTTWTMAAEMTVDSPLLGQGPGGFEAATPRYVPPGVTEVRETVVHQMYLDVSAELGLLGLAAFGTVLACGVQGARRARASARVRPLADAVLIAFAGTLVAACFLSEQFYLPVWLLAALGLAMAPERHPGRN